MLNKLWVGQGEKFYNSSMQKLDNDISKSNSHIPKKVVLFAWLQTL